MRIFVKRSGAERIHPQRATAMRMFGDYENEFIKLQLNYERSYTLE